MTTLEALTDEQIGFYEENGYLVLERRVPMDRIEAIRSEIARFTAEARGMTEFERPARSGGKPPAR